MLLKRLVILFSFFVGQANAASPERLVSIGGAATEIIYLLGAGAKIVGTDTTSYYPPQAARTPKVGYQRALSAEGIIARAPDLVILNSEAGPPPVLMQLKAAKIRLLRLKPTRSVDDMLVNITRLGAALGKEKAAANLTRDIADQRAELMKMRGSSGKAKVLIAQRHGGRAPLAAGRGTAADRIIALAGGQNVVTGYGGYKPLTPEAGIALAPDIIIVAVPRAKAIKDKSQLKRHKIFDATPAGRQGRVYVMDALEVLDYGPRIMDAARRINALIRAP